MLLLEQLVAERLTGLGSSDAHHLRSTPPWGCVRRLSYEKRNVAPDFPEAERRIKRWLRRGQMLEPVAAYLYTEATGRKLWRSGVRRHPQFPELLAHQDRQIVGVEGKPGRGVLEIKVPGAGAYQKYSQEGLPAPYVLQLQWAMLVTGAQWGAFCMFWADGFEVQQFDIDRDEALCSSLADQGRRVWREIQEGRELDPLSPDDARCARCPWRRTCWGPALAVGLGDYRDLDIPQDDTLLPLVNDYVEAQEYRVSAEELEEAIGILLRGQLADREIVYAGNHKVFFKTAKDSIELDEKAIKTAKPKFVEWLYDRFGKKRRGGRRLRIY